jgi:hypothetical protein
MSEEKSVVMSEIKTIKQKAKDWRLLEFFVPIEEKVFDEVNDEFFIRGVAINETTTLNNVKYIAEELEKGASTWRNVPILLDHKNEVKNIVGRTTEKVNWNPVARRVDFEGKIMDKQIREMIKDGRIQSVSIGAKVDDLIEETDGSKKAVGIRGLELSLVAVPGDSHANLAQAFDSNFHLKEMAELDSKDEVKDEVEDKKDEVKDEVKNVEDKNVQTQLNNKEEKMAEDVTEVAKSESIEQKSEVVEKLQKDVESLKELIVSSFSEMKKAQEKIKAEESVKKLDETKGVITAEVVEKSVASDIVVESAGNKASLYGDFSKNPNLKRLVR